MRTSNLASFLEQPKNFTTLDLSDQNLDSVIEQAGISEQALIMVIKDSNLVSLRLNNCDISNISLISSIVTQTKVKSLFLNKNNFEPGSLLAIRESLLNNDYIEILSLSNNNFNIDDIYILCELINKENSSVRDLRIDYNNLGPADDVVHVIDEMLESNKTLKNLSIKGYLLGTVDIELIASLIESVNNSALFSLDIADNQININYVDCLIGMISNSSLKKLNLSYNNLGNEGFEAIYGFLSNDKNLTELKRLDFIHNNVTLNNIETSRMTALISERVNVSVLENNSVSEINIENISQLTKEKTNMKTITEQDIVTQEIENIPELAVTEVVQEPAATEVTQEPAAIEVVQEPAATEIVQEPAATEVVQEPAATEVVEPSIIEMQPENKTINPRLYEVLANNFDPEQGNIGSFAPEDQSKELYELVRDGHLDILNFLDKGIIILGKTGVGKSTIANILTNKTVVGKEDSSGDISIEVEGLDNTFPISDDMSSCTKKPNKEDINGVSLWDGPGFSDTNRLQEIANSLYTKELIEKSDYLKFVLVVTETDIRQGRGTEFVKTVETFLQTLDYCPALESSNLSIIVNQARAGRQVESIMNSIDRILKDNKKITQTAKDLISNLSEESFSIIETPEEPGILGQYENLLDKILTTGGYIESSHISPNMIISEEAKEKANELLDEVKFNINKALETVAYAITNLENSVDIYSGNNVFMENYKFIRKWIPENTIHKTLPTHNEGEYFLNIERLDKIKSSIKEYINKEETDLDVKVETLCNILETISEYVTFDEGNNLKNYIQDYAYNLSQQTYYLKFFSEVCEQNMPDLSGIDSLISYLDNFVSEELDNKIINLELSDNNDDSAYYNKALEYLSPYNDSPECIINKAKAYSCLGSITTPSGDNNQEIIGYYINALRHDINIESAWKKLGDICFKHKHYKEAIECFKVIKDVVSIDKCFQKWETIAEDKVEFYNLQGDYHFSYFHKDQAIYSYQRAFYHAQNSEVKMDLNLRIKDIARIDHPDFGMEWGCDSILNLPENLEDIINPITSMYKEQENIDALQLSNQGEDHTSCLAGQDGNLIPEYCDDM